MVDGRDSMWEVRGQCFCFPCHLIPENIIAINQKLKNPKWKIACVNLLKFRASFCIGLAQEGGAYTKHDGKNNECRARTWP